MALQISVSNCRFSVRSVKQNRNFLACMECGDLSPLWYAAEPQLKNFFVATPSRTKAVTSPSTPYLLKFRILPSHFGCGWKPLCVLCVEMFHLPAHSYENRCILRGPADRTPFMPVLRN